MVGSGRRDRGPRPAARCTGRHHAQRQGSARRAHTRCRWAMPARARGRHVLPHADVMLAVGCRFTEVMTDWRRMPVPKMLIQIDLDPEQIGMNHPVDRGDRRRRQGRTRAPWSRLCRRRASETAGASCGKKRGRSPGQAGMADRHAARGASGRRPRIHRCLRDGLSHAGGLAVTRSPAVFLSVQLHHAGLGVSGRDRRGRGLRRRAGASPSAETAGSS